MWSVVLTIVATLLFSLAIFGIVEGNNDAKEKIKKIYKQYNFLPSKEYFTLGNETGIAYDDKQRSFLLFSHIEPNKLEVKDKIYHININDILEVRIIEDGIATAKTDRKSQLAGVAVGSVLAGGIGAVIGGLSAKQYSNKKVNNLQLEFIVNDSNNPIRRVSFMPENTTSKQNSNEYKRYYEQAYYWYKLTEVLLHQGK